MKAIVWDKYGKAKHLKYKEIDKPNLKSDEILIKVHATTVTAGDCEIRGLKFSPLLNTMMRLFFGPLKPRNIVLGQEYAGEVVEIGSDVNTFKVGDEVYGATDLSFGAYAEYMTAKEKGAVSLKPKNMSFEEAAGVPVGGIEALHFLNLANLKEGEHLLINGAGGSIGTAALQMAKSRGAQVTVVDSEDKLDMLSFIGADHLINYRTEDYRKNKDTYDVVFDVVGGSSFYKSIGALKEKGRFIMANPKGLDKLKGRLTNMKGQKHIIMQTSDRYKKDLECLTSLIESGKMITVIDTYFALNKMAEAHEYVESGKKKGNLIITIEESLLH